MTNTNITNFRKNAFEYVEQAIQYNEVITVTTKSGNAIVLSEEDYNGLMETLYLSSNATVKDEIIAGLNEALGDCISSEEVEW